MAEHVSRAKYYLVGYYLLFSIWLIAFVLYRPSYNWDMIAYIACARKFEFSDKQAIHHYVFNELRESIPPHIYDDLTTGGYKEEVSADAEVLDQQLAFYQIRVAYVAMIFLLAKFGVNIVLATYLISAISVVFGIWLLYFSFSRYVRSDFLYLIPILGIPLGLIQTARSSTPDGLAFLAICAIVYCLIRRSPILFLLMPLAILIRTDIVIFVLLVLTYTYLFIRSWRLYSVGALLVSLCVYLFLNKHFGYYGWSVLFHHTFIDPLTHPADANIEISIGQYLFRVIKGAGASLQEKPFFSYIGLTILSIWVFPWQKRLIYCQNKIFADTSFLLICSVVCVLLYFVLFPLFEERRFIGVYMLMACSFLFLLSNLGIGSNKSLTEGSPNEL